jgi:hypothetical protein
MLVFITRRNICCDQRLVLRQGPTLPNPIETAVIKKSRKMHIASAIAITPSLSVLPNRCSGSGALIRIVHEMGYREIAGAFALCWGTIQRIGTISRLSPGSFGKGGDKPPVTVHSHKTAQEGVPSRISSKQQARDRCDARNTTLRFFSSRRTSRGARSRTAAGAAGCWREPWCAWQT